MHKVQSKLVHILRRLLKVVIAAFVIPPLAVSLVSLMRDHLLIDTQLSKTTFIEWIDRGFLSYLGVHILLYRPAPLFRLFHQWFSTVSGWLFGGQVASVERTRAPARRGRSAGKGDAGGSGADGSTLVAFSPYAVPFSMMLVCVIGWIANRWLSRSWTDGPIGFCIGVAIAFHWLMTADELQQQRKRWFVETYLLAIELVFVITVLLGAMCLPLVIPDFSFIQWLADALQQAQMMYTTTFQQLFGV